MCFTNSQILVKERACLVWGCTDGRRLAGVGFTLMEVIVVVALFSVLAAASLYFGMDSYRMRSMKSERATYVSTLKQARNRALAMVCLGPCIGADNDAKAHGVHIGTSAYVLFQGTTYNSADPTNTAIPFEHSVSFSNGAGGAAPDILFTPFSGTTTGATVRMQDSAGQSTDIVVDSEGGIDWTK